jgi:WD40 repeat protein
MIWRLRSLAIVACIAAIVSTSPAGLFAADTVYRVLKGHMNIVHSVAFSPDGTLVASGSADKTVKIWDVKTGKVTRTLLHGDAVQAVRFSPSGDLVASAGVTAKLWEMRTGRLRLELEGLRQADSLAFSPLGETLAVGDGAGRNVKVWSLRTERLIHTLVDKDIDARALAFSPDGRTIAVGLGLDVPPQVRLGVTLWEASTGRPTGLLLTQHGVQKLAYSPDGRWLAAAGPIRQGTILPRLTLFTLRDAPSSVELPGPMPSFSPLAPPVHALVFLPDGRTLVVSYGKLLWLWDVKTHKRRAVLNAPDLVDSLSVTQNGGTLAGAIPGGIVLWRLK